MCMTFGKQKGVKSEEILAQVKDTAWILVPGLKGIKCKISKKSVALSNMGLLTGEIVKYSKTLV